MKLIICVVSDNKDAHTLLEELMKKEYRVTKLASTGGFLKKGNTTLLIGVEQQQVDDVIQVIGNICQSRKQFITPIPPLPGPAEPFLSYPVEVMVGGAAVFVVDVEKSVKF
ncbi:MAG: cyclic-di-AMP receptor [Peptococcaceae bacterium]|jgi:uncharacterized protein YaaQ|nr:cyclic-di-AMP receptor [Peptococcaceae bacterium]MDH7525174.1 cyclic-di-AMP receptor [Peptococcaceae bacterium]